MNLGCANTMEDKNFIRNSISRKLQHSSDTHPVTEEDLSEESVSFVSYGRLVCIQALTQQK